MCTTAASMETVLVHAPMAIYSGTTYVYIHPPHFLCACCVTNTVYSLFHWTSIKSHTHATCIVVCIWQYTSSLGSTGTLTTHYIIYGSGAYLIAWAKSNCITYYHYHYPISTVHCVGYYGCVTRVSCYEYNFIIDLSYDMVCLYILASRHAGKQVQITGIHD